MKDDGEAPALQRSEHLLQFHDLRGVSMAGFVENEHARAGDQDLDDLRLAAAVLGPDRRYRRGSMSTPSLAAISRKLAVAFFRSRRRAPPAPSMRFSRS